MLFLIISVDSSFAAITSNGIAKVSLRAAKHPEFFRIVFMTSEDITKNAVISLTNEKLVKVAFSHPVILTFSYLEEEKAIPIGEGLIDVMKGVKILAGSNFCLIKVEGLENYKLSRLTNPPRVVIDAYTVKMPEPLKSSSQPMDVIAKRAFNSFVIDPGHGGYDKGIHDDNNREKNIVLNIAKDMAQMLSTGGKKVFLTRKADQRVSIKDRITSVNERHPDILLSIHMSPNNVLLIYTDVPEKENPSDAIKAKMAEDVAGNVINSVKREFDFSVGHERLPIPLLKQVKIPALLIELPNFNSFLYDKKNSEKLIKAIIKGLVQTPQN